MDKNDLREAQAKFQTNIPDLARSRRHLYDLRRRFVTHFTPLRIRRMKINQFAIGSDRTKNDLVFCYTLERGLDQLGRITGATASKFGVYNGRTRADNKKKYRFTKKFGRTSKQAYENVKESILQLLTAGKINDLDSIANNKLSSMFKGKILATYYPNKYLNIFSDKHLNHFLQHLGIDYQELMQRDEIYKREALVLFKKNDPVMRNWTLDVFTRFLYEGFPGGPQSATGRGASDPLVDYRLPKFPVSQQPSFVKLVMLPQGRKARNKEVNLSRDNPDYEKQSRLFKKYGDRGEILVLEMERKRLKDAKRPSLAKKVVKAKRDSLGYDIESREIDDSIRYIEVKATRAEVGNANFYLSQNELNKAQKLKNYCVYIVFNILSKTPKIWQIPNPFKPDNKKVIRTPVKYRVEIKAKL
jgi:hypothetical protein